MVRGIESSTLLVICCEGDSKNLTEKNYFKQLHIYHKNNKSKFIKFTNISFIKIKIDKIFKITSLINTLESRGLKAQFSFIVIWKDNDTKEVQKENEKIIEMETKLFQNLKQYLLEEKQREGNFALWLLPKGWNFETFYRNHFTNKLKMSDRKLKSKVLKKKDYCFQSIINDECFATIATNLKKAKSNITLFQLEDEEN